MKLSNLLPPLSGLKFTTSLRLSCVDSSNWSSRSSTYCASLSASSDSSSRDNKWFVVLC